MMKPSGDFLQMEELEMVYLVRIPKLFAFLLLSQFVMQGGFIEELELWWHFFLLFRFIRFLRIAPRLRVAFSS